MPITIEAFEDSGAASGGRGSTILQVNNVGHKSTFTSEAFHFSYYPIERPSPSSSNEDQWHGVSYHKYTHFKISGTYNSATRVRIRMLMDTKRPAPEDNVIINSSNTKIVSKIDDEEKTISVIESFDSPEDYLVFTDVGVRLIYKWTNVYTTPTENMLNGTTWDMSTPTTLIPCLSTSGPNTATQLVHVLQPNQTYYTNFLVTQVHLDKGTLEDYGNMPLIRFEVTLDEYETDVTSDYSVEC